MIFFVDLRFYREKDIQKIVASVVDLNSASANILKRLGFKQVKKIINEEMQLPETKYELYL
jgi:RimJ/RimL family protein N-acetyltransferase